MTEVLRMRFARAPQRTLVAAERVTLTHPNGTSVFLDDLITAADPRERARNQLTSAGLSPPARHAPFLADIDQWLNNQDNRPALADLFPFFGGQPGGTLDEAVRNWLTANQQDRLSIGDLLVACLFADATPELCGHLTRLMTIIGTMEALLASLRAGTEAEFSFEEQRLRTIVFPAQVLALASRWSQPRRFVSRIGFSDLFTVRTEWIAYEPGEIAHIENVLPGELKKRKHVRLDEREATVTEETETRRLNEQDNQTTDRFELQEEAQRDVQLDIHAEGQVDTSGQYGPTKVDTHIGGSLDYSATETRRRATTQSTETVSRAITRIEERVRRARTERTLTRIEETNAHEINNATGASIAGIYRWVDKVQRYQIFRYPNRYLLELQVPEPAAWIRWLRHQARPQTRNPQPDPLTLNGEPVAPANPTLVANNISAENYQEIGARYGALGLTAPPRSIIHCERFVQDTVNPRDENTITGNDPVRFIRLESVRIPEGYVATRWSGYFSAWGEELHGAQQPTIEAFVGNNNYVFQLPTQGAYFNFVGPTTLVIFPYEEGRISNEFLPISIRLESIRGCAVHLIIEFAPIVAFERWRISTYEQIVDAYETMRRRYEEELRSAEIAQGSPIEGASSLQNAEVVREELKKSVITMFFGNATAQDPFSWGNLIDRNPTTGEPFIRDAAAAVDRAPIIQFLEQAFEWEKMTYVLYPYFWADHGSSWTTLAALESADPQSEYARFLRSGSARVVVSARPGFENHVHMFVHFGKIWSGGAVPSPQDPDYLSVAEEIKALYRAPDEGEPVEWWDARLPTTLVWLQGATPLPVKPERERELGEHTGAASGRPLAIRPSFGQSAIAGSSRPIYIGTWLVLGPIFDPRHQVDDHFDDRQMGREAEHPWANDIIMAIDQHASQLDPAGITADLQRSPKDGDRIVYGGDPSRIFTGREYIWRRRSFRGLDWSNTNDVGDNIHLFLPADEVAESYDPDNDFSFSHKHHALAFFLAYVHSRSAKTTNLLVRSDDALRAWLNGSEIVGLRWTHEREIDETETSASVRLDEGWNVLLLAVAETHVEWGLSGRFEDAEGLRFSAIHPDWLYSSTPALRVAGSPS